MSLTVVVVVVIVVVIAQCQTYAQLVKANIFPGTGYSAQHVVQKISAQLTCHAMRALSLSLSSLPSLIVIPLLSCFTSHGLAFPQLHIRIRFRRGSHNYYYYYFYYYLPLVFSRIAFNAPFNRAGGARQIATRNFHLTTLSLGTSPLS